MAVDQLMAGKEGPSFSLAFTSFAFGLELTFPNHTSICTACFPLLIFCLLRHRKRSSISSYACPSPPLVKFLEILAESDHGTSRAIDAKCCGAYTKESWRTADKQTNALLLLLFCFFVRKAEATPGRWRRPTQGPRQGPGNSTRRRRSMAGAGYSVGSWMVSSNPRENQSRSTRVPRGDWAGVGSAVDDWSSRGLSSSLLLPGAGPDVGPRMLEGADGGCLTAPRYSLRI